MVPDKTSLNVTYTDPNGKKCTKAITDINPYASTYYMKEFAQALFQTLSNNHYEGAEIVQRTTLVPIPDPNNASVAPCAYRLGGLEDADPQEIVLDLFYCYDLGGDRTVTVSGKKPLGFNIAIEDHKITLTPPAGWDIDDYWQANGGTAEMRITISPARSGLPNENLLFIIYDINPEYIEDIS